jgi:hypothetical protein
LIQLDELGQYLIQLNKVGHDIHAQCLAVAVVVAVAVAVAVAAAVAIAFPFAFAFLELHTRRPLLPQSEAASQVEASAYSMGLPLTSCPISMTYSPLLPYWNCNIVHHHGNNNDCIIRISQIAEDGHSHPTPKAVAIRVVDV